MIYCLTIMVAYWDHLQNEKKILILDPTSRDSGLIGWQCGLSPVDFSARR